MLTASEYEVSETEGTGLVHIAPGCGKEDFALGKEFDLKTIAPLDELGVYLSGFDWLTGKDVRDVAKPIIEDLHKRGVLYDVGDYSHRYPVCWRCNSELVFRLVDEWFISMDTLRDEIADSAKRVEHWIPEFGLARELDWLKNMAPIQIEQPYSIVYLHSYAQDSPWFAGLTNKKILANRDPESGYTYAQPRGHDMYSGEETEWIDITSDGKERMIFAVSSSAQGAGRLRISPFQSSKVVFPKM